MKKIVLFAAAIISLSNFAFAQAAKTAPSATHSSAAMQSPEQRAKTLTDKMQEKLNLTASQHESMYKANLEIANRMSKAKTSHDKAAMNAVRSYRSSEYKKILTGQQMAILDQSMAARKNK